MHYHIILTSEMTYEKNISFGVVFIPNAVFVRGEQKILIPDRSVPEYRQGFLANLFREYPEFNIEGKNKKAFVVIENIGHGTKEDLDMLQLDLMESGFEVRVFGDIDE